LAASTTWTISSEPGTATFKMPHTISCEITNINCANCYSLLEYIILRATEDVGPQHPFDEKYPMAKSVPISEVQGASYFMEDDSGACPGISGSDFVLTRAQSKCMYDRYPEERARIGTSVC